MKKRNNSPGASIRNTESELTSKGMWRNQSSFTSNIQYMAVYEVLDELSQKGYNCYQIEQIIKLGEGAYKNGKTI